MTNGVSAGIGWLCPACARRVPGQVAECRCGYIRNGPASAPGADDAAATSLSGPSAALRVGIVTLVGLAAITGVAWYINEGHAVPAKSSRTSLSSQPTSVEASRPAATVAPAAATVATPFGSVVAPARPNDTLSASPARDATGSRTASLEDVVGRVMSAVVRVETSGGTGSGFFVTPDTLLTNAHVVEGHATVTIRWPAGTTAIARVATTSPDFDIAILKISNPLPDQVTIPMGSTATTRVGEEVIAIGSALGILQNTVTRGIVSGVRRSATTTFVQTDAALNPGNSGGPLLDRSGTAIGINTLGFKDTQGLNFAVSIDHARAVLEGRPQPATSSAEPARNDPVRAFTPAPPSETDRRRADGLHAYEDTLIQLAGRADALDDYWRQFKARCYKGPIVGSFERGWYAIWSQRAMQGTVASGCQSAFGDIQHTAAEISNQMLAADEAARHSDVFPGLRRDLRRKYRLDYAGWDR